MISGRQRLLAASRLELRRKKVASANMKKSKLPSKDSSADPKRLKFLERNRAAATRCREKKKQWLQELQDRANVLTSSNRDLHNNLRKLREEVAQLRNTVSTVKVRYDNI